MSNTSIFDFYEFVPGRYRTIDPLSAEVLFGNFIFPPKNYTSKDFFSRKSVAYIRLKINVSLSYFFLKLNLTQV